MAATSLPKPTIKMLRPNDLAIDPLTQRRFDQGHADRIAAKFEPGLVGTLAVSARGDKYYVFDGQHRRCALVKVGLGDVPIPCAVYQGMTIEEEARSFVGRNAGAKKPHIIDIFRVRVTAQDPVAVDINNIVEAAGLHIAFDSTDGAVSAVAALERVYYGKNGPHPGVANPGLLMDVLAVLQGAWGNQRAAYDGHLITGLGLVLSRFGEQIDTDALIRSLAMSGNPATMIGQAKALKVALGGNLFGMVGEVIISTYNKGRRKNLLPSIKHRGGAA